MPAIVLVMIIKFNPAEFEVFDVDDQKSFPNNRQ
jgi:hypothetical protein